MITHDLSPSTQTSKALCKDTLSSDAAHARTCSSPSGAQTWFQMLFTLYTFEQCTTGVSASGHLSFQLGLPRDRHVGQYMLGTAGSPEIFGLSVLHRNHIWGWLPILPLARCFHCIKCQVTHSKTLLTASAGKPLKSSKRGAGRFGGQEAWDLDLPLPAF